jgi:hypothetical protein
MSKRVRINDGNYDLFANKITFHDNVDVIIQLTTDKFKANTAVIIDATITTINTSLITLKPSSEIGNPNSTIGTTIEYIPSSDPVGGDVKFTDLTGSVGIITDRLTVLDTGDINDLSVNLLKLKPQSSPPLSVDNEIIVYHQEGSNDVWYNSNNENLTLASDRRALAYSMIF